MKQFNLIKIIFATLPLSLLCSMHAIAQMDSCNVFLKGTYIEVGVNTNGAYGSSVDAPPGFHPKGATGVGNVCDSSCPDPQQNLGFVADPAKDGWTVGSPPYIGDYFLPGTPQEGWSIQIDTFQANAWNGNGFCGSWATYPFSSSRLTGSNISYTTSGTKLYTVWQGSLDSLGITQLTIMDTNTVYFTVYITLTNKSSSTYKNVFYLRTLDPDNDEPEPMGSFTTTNKIAYQLPNAKNRTLVTAVGTVYPKLAYLGLGTLDCRAKCFINKSGLMPTSGNLDSMYQGKGGIGDTADYIYDTAAPAYVNDVGIGLVFKLGDIPAGDSVNFAYAYVLRAADLDSAFLSTQPKWIDGGDSSALASGDTASVCKNSIVPISIVNGAYLNWFWFPSTNLDKDSGTTVHARVGTTSQTYTVIGSSPSCVSDTLIITVKPDLAPPPGVKDTLTYCKDAVVPPLTAAGQNLRWYRSNSPSDTGTTVAPIPRTDTVANSYYYVSQTVRGCTSDRSRILVIVYPPLPALNVSNNGPLCLHENLMLYADSSLGATYLWQGPNGFSSTDRNAVLPNVAESDTGNYSLVATVGGCPSDTSFTHLSIDQVVAAIAIDHDSICFTPIAPGLTNVSFNGTAPDTGTTYTWSFPGSLNATGAAKGPYTLTYNDSGIYPIQVGVHNWRCNDTATIYVNVNFGPPTVFTVKKDLCVNDTSAITVAPYSLQNALSLAWNFDGGTVTNGEVTGNYSISYKDTGMKVITLTIKFPYCYETSMDTVMVHHLPAGIEGISRNNICLGDTVVFSAAATGAGYIYTWKPAAYFGQYDKANPDVTGKIPNSGFIYLTTTDSFGCQGTDSLFVTTQACCGVYLPSAFTPNGDGKNDIFRPITIGHHNLRVFRVVNRWGQTVFESNNEQLGWDGKLFGVPQDADTYYWYINYDCDGKTIEEKGEVVLIR